MIKQYILGAIAGILFKLLRATWRYEIIFHDDCDVLPLYAKKLQKTYILAHWHGDELALIGHAGYAPFLTITSDSKDGSIMDVALKIIGKFTTSRGSSTRGAVKALIGIMKKMEKGHYFISFATDGPKGPIHQAKPGFLSIAKKKNIDVFQVLVKCESRWDFPKSWNKTYLPKPFAKIEIHYIKHPSANEVEQEEFLNNFNRYISPNDLSTEHTQSFPLSSLTEKFVSNLN